MIEVTFGLPEEQNQFCVRNARFLEVLPQLRARIDQVLSREFTPEDKAQIVVFVLGRLIVEDFMEILLNCANGYGMAGLKLLRPMFEALVTALYLARQLKPLGVRVTRLASGLPVGGDLDYADELTLGRALVGRQEM